MKAFTNPQGWIGQTLHTSTGTVKVTDAAFASGSATLTAWAEVTDTADGPAHDEDGKAIRTLVIDGPLNVFIDGLAPEGEIDLSLFMV